MKGKIRKIRQKTGSREGFTLIEMIIATALVGIIFTMVAAIVPTWYKAYHKTMELNHARQIADSIMGTIEETLRFANELDVPDNPYVPGNPPDWNDTNTCITGHNGSSKFRIPMEPLDGESGEHFRIDGLVYDDNYLMGKKVELEFAEIFDATGKKACEVTVKLTEEDGTTVLTKKRTVGLYGMDN